MRLLRHVFALLMLTPFTHVARAQIIVLDQVSPFEMPSNMAHYNVGLTTYTWQQQVRVGIAGQLRSIEFQGAPLQVPSTFRVRIRLGSAWSLSPVVYETLLDQTALGIQTVFADASSAGLQFEVGDVFVMEFQGVTPGAWLKGTGGTSSNPPFYSEPFLLDGTCVSHCGDRLGFRTYMRLDTPATPFCFGDGSGTACPCGNIGAVGSGCASTASSTGAKLTVRGVGAVSSSDTLALTATGILGPGLFMQGDGQVAAGSVFGDGLLCLTGASVRLGTVFPSGGSASLPNAVTPNSLHQAGAANVGDVRHYQCWYRDNLPFCTPATFNLTQGLTLTWEP